MSIYRKAVFAIVLALVLAPFGAWAQHDHSKAPAQKQKTQEMMGDHETVKELLDEATAAFDQAAAASDAAQQRAALEKGRAKLAEFRKLMEKHHAEMSEHMKTCPMMKDKAQHMGHH